MSSQVVTTTEGENDNQRNNKSRFNFEDWINKNDLNKVKELFIKHNATTILTLNLSSLQLQSLMTDPLLLSKPQQIPKIMNAIQSISLSFLCIYTTVIGVGFVLTKDFQNRYSLRGSNWFNVKSDTELQERFNDKDKFIEMVTPIYYDITLKLQCNKKLCLIDKIYGSNSAKYDKFVHRHRL